MILKISKLVVIAFLTTQLNNALADSNQNPLNSKNDLIAGITPLMMAVSDGDIDGVNFFLNSTNHGNLNQKNIGGATALHIAARQSNAQITQILINNGADVNVKDNEGWTPLMRAANQANNKAVVMLIDAGAKVDELNKNGESAIIHSTKSSCYKCIENIFENIKHHNSFKNTKILSDQISTSFLKASQKEDEQIIKLLKSYQEIIKTNQIEASGNEITKDFIKVEEGEAVKKQKKYVIKSSKDNYEKSSTKTSNSSQAKLPATVETQIMDLKPSTARVYKFKNSNQTSVDNKRYIFKRY